MQEESEYIIENNIECPPPSRGRGAPPKYPFGDMEVGESLMISGIYSRQIMANLSNAARNWKNNTNKYLWRFEFRKWNVIDEKNNTIGVGIRCFRIA